MADDKHSDVQDDGTKRKQTNQDTGTVKHDNGSTTHTMRYGGNQTQPATNVNSPSVHDLAVQSVEESFGPDAHNNPTFDERVKDVEAQMLDSIEKTKDM